MHSSLALSKACLKKKSRIGLRLLTVQTAVIGLLFSSCSIKKADSFTFTKIADNNTSIPGRKGNFKSFKSPSIDDKNVGFSANGKQVQGIYTNIRGSLYLVADTNTSIPGGKGKFTFLPDSPAIDHNNVAFRGFGSSFKQSGIYTNIGGLLNVVADTNTPIPNGGGRIFTAFGGPSIYGRNVAFDGRGGKSSSGVSGIYTKIGSVLNVVADTNTRVPGTHVPHTTGKFTRFSIPSLNDGNVAFIGYDFNGSGSGGQEGIYTNIRGSLKVVADRNTPIPGGTGKFYRFRIPSLDGQNMAFVGGGSGAGPFGSPQGIYIYINGSLKVVADTNTPIPGGKGKFTQFGSVSFNGKNVAFQGFGSGGQEGIYTNITGSLSKVIALNDSLDGKTVSFINFSPKGLSNNQIVFRAGLGSPCCTKDGIFITTRR